MNNAERNYIVDKALEDVHVVNPAKSREELSHRISSLYREKKISKLEMVELKIYIADISQQELNELYWRLME
jgi:hypothetical protein